MHMQGVKHCWTSFKFAKSAKKLLSDSVRLFVVNMTNNYCT